MDGTTVSEVVDRACDRYGHEFAAVVAQCAIWLNGEPAELDATVSIDDEVALLPPVSGGSVRCR